MVPTAGSEPIVLGEPGFSRCPECGAEVERVLRGHGQVRWWLPGRHDCPALAAKRAEAVRRAEEAAREHEEWLRNPPPARIEHVHRTARLPWWTPPGLAAVPEVAQSVQSLAPLRDQQDEWLRGRRPGRGLWLWGDTGLWKTGATCALLFDVAHLAGRRVLVWNFADLMSQLRRSAQGMSHEWDPERAAAAEALLIDDIAAMTATEAARRTLYELINAANDSWGAAAPTKTLYVTSDRPPEEMLDCLDPDGSADAAARRIIRRLSQLCEVVEVRRHEDEDAPARRGRSTA